MQWYPIGLSKRINKIHNNKVCTGSLITPVYFLSAAHCTGEYKGVNFSKLRRKCIQNTALYGHYQGAVGVTVECRRLHTGDVEVIFGFGQAWLGLKRDHKNMRKIKRQIRHQYFYPGPLNYDVFAGYDIDLVEIEKPFFAAKQVCLPSPSFDDLRLNKKDSMHAWFGLHLRFDKTCQTNRFGMMKFHFCDKRYGNGNKACNLKDPPPTDMECKNFFKKSYTPDNVPNTVEEIRILSYNGKSSTYCYPNKNPEIGSKGWCKTFGNFYNWKKINETHQGWGFCSKECFKKSLHKNMFTLKRNVNILSDKMCSDLMSNKFRIPDSFKIDLRVLCKGPVRKFEESVWVKNNQEYESAEVTKKAKRFGVTSYVASSDTCDGIVCGGPLFVKSHNKFVITGNVGC